MFLFFFLSADVYILIITYNPSHHLPVIFPRNNKSVLKSSRRERGNWAYEEWFLSFKVRYRLLFVFELLMSFFMWFSSLFCTSSRYNCYQSIIQSFNSCGSTFGSHHRSFQSGLYTGCWSSRRSYLCRPRLHLTSGFPWCPRKQKQSTNRWTGRQIRTHPPHDAR